MYSHLMVQTFDLKRTDGTDEYGQPNVVEEKKNVPCRITFKLKLIVSSNGQQQTSEGNILTNEKVCIGDLITLYEREYKVISVNPLYDFDNQLQGYQAYF